MSAAIGLWMALTLAAAAQPPSATARQINLNLLAPPLPPPQPTWSNFQVPAPQPPSRPAWLPRWLVPDRNRPPSAIARTGRSNGVGRVFNAGHFGGRCRGGHR